MVSLYIGKCYGSRSTKAHKVHSRLEIQNTRFEILDSRFEIWDSISKLTNRIKDLSAYHCDFFIPLNKRYLYIFYNTQIWFLFQFMFLSVLVTYSAFVLTSVGTKYYSQFTARAMEYYVYIWSFGDSIEEIMGCIVSCFFFNSFSIVLYYFDHLYRWP